MQSSILSYPKRGPWGSSTYPGNCSGHLISALLTHFKPTLFVDPAEGSGTSRDVANELGVRYAGLDLKDGFNLLEHRLSELVPDEPDFIFFHPPYHNIIPYSGNVWGEPHPDDLSRCETYTKFLRLLECACFNIWHALRSGGHLAILIGDIRRNGTYQSPQAHIQQLPLGQLTGILIKKQFNTRSSHKQYSGQFIPIAHEYLLIFRK